MPRNERSINTTANTTKRKAASQSETVSRKKTRSATKAEAREADSPDSCVVREETSKVLSKKVQEKGKKEDKRGKGNKEEEKKMSSDEEDYGSDQEMSDLEMEEDEDSLGELGEFASVGW